MNITGDGPKRPETVANASTFGVRSTSADCRILATRVATFASVVGVYSYSLFMRLCARRLRRSSRSFVDLCRHSDRLPSFDMENYEKLEKIGEGTYVPVAWSLLVSGEPPSRRVRGRRDDETKRRRDGPPPDRQSFLVPTLASQRPHLTSRVRPSSSGMAKYTRLGTRPRGRLWR